MKLIAILCVISAALAIVGGDIPGAIGHVLLYASGVVAGAMLLVVAAAYRERELERAVALRAVKDNPRCFCPDCGADLGSFYSNRIQMERKGKR
jgi:hypothetical protein